MKKLILITLFFLFTTNVFALPAKVYERRRFELSEQKHKHKLGKRETKYHGQILIMNNYYSMRVERKRYRRRYRRRYRSYKRGSLNSYARTVRTNIYDW